MISDNCNDDDFDEEIYDETEEMVIEEGREYTNYINPNEFINQRNPTNNLNECIKFYEEKTNKYRTEFCPVGLEWRSFYYYIKYCIFPKLKCWSYKTSYPELKQIAKIEPTMKNLCNLLQSTWTYRKFYNQNQLKLIQQTYNSTSPYHLNNDYAQISFSFAGLVKKVKCAHLIIWMNDDKIVLLLEDGSHKNHDSLSWQLLGEDHNSNNKRNECPGPKITVFSGSKSIIVSWKDCSCVPHCEWSGFQKEVQFIKKDIVLDLSILKDDSDYLLIQDMDFAQNFNNLYNLINKSERLKMCLLNGSTEVAIVGTDWSLNLLQDLPCFTDKKINIWDGDWECLKIPKFDIEKFRPFTLVKPYSNKTEGLQKIKDFNLLYKKNNQPEYREIKRRRRRNQYNVKTTNGTKRRPK